MSKMQRGMLRFMSFLKRPYWLIRSKAFVQSKNAVKTSEYSTVERKVNKA